jgi:hypothetical protein
MTRTAATGATPIVSLDPATDAAYPWGRWPTWSA